MGDSTKLTLLDSVSDQRVDQRPFVAPRRRLRHHARRVGSTPAVTVPDIDVSALAWQAESVCSTADPDLFFPEGPVHPHVLGLCHSCPVMPECLEYALADPRLHGVWAATTGEERHRIRDRARRKAV